MRRCQKKSLCLFSLKKTHSTLSKVMFWVRVELPAWFLFGVFVGMATSTARVKFAQFSCVSLILTPKFSECVTHLFLIPNLDFSISRRVLG